MTSLTATMPSLTSYYDVTNPATMTSQTLYYDVTHRYYDVINQVSVKITRTLTGSRCRCIKCLSEYSTILSATKRNLAIPNTQT